MLYVFSGGVVVMVIIIVVILIVVILLIIIAMIPKGQGHSCPARPPAGHDAAAQASNYDYRCYYY